MLHATWLKNRASTRALGGKTPYEARYGSPPDLRGIRPFGAKVFVRLEKAPKMQSKAREGHFVGFADNSQAYRVYWPDRRATASSTTGEPQIASTEGRTPSGRDRATPAGPPQPLPTFQNVGDSPGKAPVPLSARPDSPAPGASPPSVPAEPLEGVQAEEAAPPEEAMGRGRRIKKPSPYVRSLAKGEGTVDGRQ
ncbi:hypothetical protein BD311DRAFT_609547, partial [Dichomitus squalens]